MNLEIIIGIILIAIGTFFVNSGRSKLSVNSNKESIFNQDENRKKIVDSLKADGEKNSKKVTNVIEITKDELEDLIQKGQKEILERVNEKEKKDQSKLEYSLVENYLNDVRKTVGEFEGYDKIDLSTKIFLRNKTKILIDNISNSNKSLVLAYLSGTRLISKQFRVIDLSKMDFRGVVFDNVDFAGSILWEGDFTGAEFINCHLFDTAFFNCNLTNVVFKRCMMHDNDLNGIDMKSTSFIKCDISNWRIINSILNEKQILKDNKLYEPVGIIYSKNSGKIFGQSDLPN